MYTQNLKQITEKINSMFLQSDAPEEIQFSLGIFSTELMHLHYVWKVFPFSFKQGISYIN
jgi:hypothetical protein